MGKISCLPGFLKDFNRLDKLQQKQCSKKLQALMTGKAPLAALKGHKGIYKINVDGSTRILIAYLDQPFSDKTLTVVIGLVLGHRYDRVNVLLKNFLRNFKENKTPELQGAIEIQESDFETLEEKEEEEAGAEEQPIEWQVGEYYNHQFIILNEQQIATQKAPWPSIVIGTPGTGKTTMLLLNLLQQVKIILAEKGAVKSAFIAPTEELATRLNTLFISLPEAQNLPSGAVQFYSRDAFFRHVIPKKESEQGKEVEQKWEGEATFQQWFKKYVQVEKRQQRHKKERFTLNWSAWDVYQEFRYLSGLPLQQWQECGHRHSLQTDKKTATWLFNACEKYKQHLKEEGKIDPNLYALPKEQAAVFDCLAVDESQTANYALVQCCLTLSGNNLLLAYNNMQRLEGNDPLLPLLERRGIFHTVQLNSGYRCPELVLAVVKKFLQMKTLLAGTEREFLQIAQELEGKPGKVQLVFAEEEKHRAALRQLAQSPHVAVITQSERVAAVSQEFGTPLVFSAESAIGLNFRVVVLAYLLDKPIFREASKLLEGQELDKTYGRSGKGDARFAAEFNGWMVGATRCEEDLIIVEKQDERLHTIYQHVQDIAAQSQPVLTTTTVNQTATTEAWQKMRDRLKEEGHHTQARAVEKMYLPEEKTPTVEEIVPSTITPVQGPQASAGKRQGNRRRNQRREQKPEPKTSTIVVEKAPAKINELMQRYKTALKRFERSPSADANRRKVVQILNNLLDQSELPQMLFKAYYLGDRINLLPCAVDGSDNDLMFQLGLMWYDLMRDSKREKIKKAIQIALGWLEKPDPMIWYLLTYIHLIEHMYLNSTSMLAEVIRENPTVAQKITADMLCTFVATTNLYGKARNNAMANLATSLGYPLLTLLFENNRQLEKGVIVRLLNPPVAETIIVHMSKEKEGREWLYNLLVRNAEDPMIYDLFSISTHHAILLQLLHEHEDLYNKICYPLLWQPNVTRGICPLQVLAQTKEGNKVIQDCFHKAPAFRVTVDAKKLYAPIPLAMNFLYLLACTEAAGSDTLAQIFFAAPQLIPQIPVKFWLEGHTDKGFENCSAFFSLTTPQSKNCLALVLREHGELRRSITARHLTALTRSFSALVNLSLHREGHANLATIFQQTPSVAAELEEEVMQLFTAIPNLSNGYQYPLLYMASLESGRQCLKYIAEHNKQFFSALTVDILIKIYGTHLSTPFSFLSQLSLSPLGIEILVQIFTKRSDLIPLIPMETLFIPTSGPQEVSSIFLNLVRCTAVAVNPLDYFTKNMKAFCAALPRDALFKTFEYTSHLGSVCLITGLGLLSCNKVKLMRSIFHHKPELLDYIDFSQKVCPFPSGKAITMLASLSLSEEGCSICLAALKRREGLAKSLTIDLLTYGFPNVSIAPVIAYLIDEESGYNFLREALNLNPRLQETLINNEIIKKYCQNSPAFAALFEDLIQNNLFKRSIPREAIGFFSNSKTDAGTAPVAGLGHGK